MKHLFSPTWPFPCINTIQSCSKNNDTPLKQVAFHTNINTTVKYLFNLRHYLNFATLIGQAAFSSTGKIINNNGFSGPLTVFIRKPAVSEHVSLRYHPPAGAPYLQ